MSELLDAVNKADCELIAKYPSGFVRPAIPGEFPVAVDGLVFVEALRPGVRLRAVLDIPPLCDHMREVLKECPVWRVGDETYPLVMERH